MEQTVRMRARRAPEFTDTRPVDMERVKRSAKQFAGWTGVTLSQAQELTARALEATSWQALLQHPKFLPDEALDNHKLHDRYAELGKLLSERLHIASPVAARLAAYWQPTALRAQYRDVVDWNSDDDTVYWGYVETLCTHPALPPGCVVAVVSRSDVEGLGLGVIRSDRRAVAMEPYDCLPIRSEHAGPKLAEALQGPLDVKGRAALKRALKGPQELRWPQDRYDVFAQSTVPPCRIEASWLRSRDTAAQLLKRFQQVFPWRKADYTDLASDNSVFFSFVLNGLRFQASHYGSSVHVSAHDLGTRDVAYGSVQAGIGVLRKMTTDDDEMLRSPGFYFAKYFNQAHGRPLPGMTDEAADEVCRRMGLHGGGIARNGAPEFFASEAGLVFCMWLAGHPVRTQRQAATGNTSCPYIGDWYNQALNRMRFELARADKY